MRRGTSKGIVLSELPNNGIEEEEVGIEAVVDGTKTKMDGTGTNTMAIKEGDIEIGITAHPTKAEAISQGRL